MNILVYSVGASYWLVDESMHPPSFDPPAELVFSIAQHHLPAPVAEMLESALAQNGALELRESWADYLFAECAGWERHKARHISLMVS